MFYTNNAGKFFKILISVLTLYILVVQPAPAQEETPETSLAGQFSSRDSIGNAKLESNNPGIFANREKEQDKTGTSLLSLGQITVPAYDMGQYHESGLHSPINLNYLVGWNPIKGTYHNFFVFDLSGISSSVYAVVLRAYNPVNGYQSSDASEIWTLFDVNTAIPTLLGDAGGVSAFSDLGSGNSYGDVSVTSAADDTFIEVTFNPAGVAEINSALGGDVAIGGALTEIDSLNNQLLFSDSDSNPQAEMILYTTTPCNEVHGNPINNCSFEDNYNSWTLIDSPFTPGDPHSDLDGTWGIASDGQLIKHNESTYDFADSLMVTQVSPGLPHTYRSSDGSQLAYHLRNSYGYYRMYQDVTLGYAGDICWEMEYNNHSSNHDAIDQYLAVNIRDLNDTILTTLFKTTDGIDPIILTPMTRFCFDISAYSNMTVRFDVELYPDDNFFDSAFDNFSIEVNNPPVLDPIGDKVVDENRQLSFTVTASDMDPSDTLNFSLIGPTGASIDPVTGQFTWTPTASQGPGIYPATVYVNDDGTPNTDGDKEMFYITVNDVLFLPIALK
jgi:hypothetical protein